MYVSKNINTQKKEKSGQIPCDVSEQLSNGSSSGTGVGLDSLYESPRKSTNISLVVIISVKTRFNVYRSQIQLCILFQSNLQALDVGSKYPCQSQPPTEK
jgi:hypothetical protein